MKKIVILAMTLAVGAAIGSASTSADTINEREHRQAKRIYNGAVNGHLTYREFRKLARGQAKVHAMERRARMDGHIDPWERARIQDQLDRQNALIWNKKHN